MNFLINRILLNLEFDILLSLVPNDSFVMPKETIVGCTVEQEIILHPLRFTSCCLHSNALLFECQFHLHFECLYSNYYCYSCSCIQVFVAIIISKVLIPHLSLSNLPWWLAQILNCYNLASRNDKHRRSSLESAFNSSSMKERES